jgi:hypothetical protein
MLVLLVMEMGILGYRRLGGMLFRDFENPY